MITPFLPLANTVRHREGPLGPPFFHWEKEGLRWASSSPMLWDTLGNPWGPTAGDQREMDKGAGLIVTHT